MRTLSSSLIATSVLAVAFLGCNSILENSPGTLVETQEAGTLPEPQPPTQQQPPQGTPDAGTPPAPPEENEKPSAECPIGQRLCHGGCVSMNDPNYGCGNPSCAPCPSAHSTMGCQARACVVAACTPGYADCNANAADGCETDLSAATSCGACNAVCPATARLCAPTGPTFQCTNGCTAAAPLNCGAECVDPQTSVNHCGGCAVKCPVVENGVEQCTAGECKFTCNAMFNACGGKCTTKTDPAACGPGCVVCPVPAGGAATCVNDACGVACPAPSHACGGKCVTNDPTACGEACIACAAAPNATPTCAAEMCGIACTAGYANCDANPANGCEVTLATDPLHCGACGVSCAGQPCVNGVCQAPPPPPPP